MTYRTQGTRPEVPDEPQPPKRPVVRVTVVRYNWLWWLLALGLVAASVAIAFTPAAEMGKVGPLSVAAVIALVFALVRNWTVLRVDPETRSMNVSSRALVGRGISHDRSLEDVTEATVDSIDDSDFVSLNLVEDGKVVLLVTGGDSSCRNAAEVINAFLRDTRRKPKKKPEAT